MLAVNSKGAMLLRDTLAMALSKQSIKEDAHRLESAFEIGVEHVVEG